MKQHIEWDETGPKAREEAAKLVKASRDEIALTINTTQGINTIASSIDWKTGDNVVLNDLEFPGNVVPWFNLGMRGVKVKVLRNNNGEIEIEDLQKIVDEKTRMIAISWVQWTNGFKTDLSRLVKELSEPKGIMVFVDGVQGVGCLNLDAHKTGIDFLATGAHKWLCGPFGSGFLYVRKELIEKIKPVYAGARTIKLDRNGLQSYESPGFNPIAFNELGFKTDAEKFGNQGSPNAEGIHGLYAALRYINRIGIEKIEETDMTLSKLLVEQLSSIGARITSPLKKENRSAITSFEGNEKIVEYLKRNKVIVSLRYSSNQGGVRVSPHFYNSEEEIYKLVTLVSKYNHQTKQKNHPKTN